LPYLSGQKLGDVENIKQGGRESAEASEVKKFEDIQRGEPQVKYEETSLGKGLKFGDGQWDTKQSRQEADKEKTARLGAAFRGAQLGVQDPRLSSNNSIADIQNLDNQKPSRGPGNLVDSNAVFEPGLSSALYHKPVPPVPPRPPQYTKPAVELQGKQSSLTAINKTNNSSPSPPPSPSRERKDIEIDRKLEELKKKAGKKLT